MCERVCELVVLNRPCDVVPVCGSPNNTCAADIVDTLENQSEGRVTISVFSLARSLSFLTPTCVRLVHIQSLKCRRWEFH